MDEKLKQDVFEACISRNVDARVKELERLYDEFGSHVLKLRLDRNMWTALHQAAAYGHLDLVSWLVGKGADVSVRAQSKLTPLYCACVKGHVDVVDFLIRNGSDVNAADMFGFRMIQKVEKYPEIVALLIRNGAKASLHQIAISGSVVAAEKYLSDNNVDIDKVNLDKRTPLCFAANFGHVDMVSFLIRKGAKVNASDKFKDTPLAFAARNGHVDVAKVLIESGADVNSTRFDVRSLLHIVAALGNFEMMHLLVRNGANVNASYVKTDWFGDGSEEKVTVLRLSSESGHVPCTLLLLCCGAEIDSLSIRDDKTDILPEIEHILKAQREGTVKRLYSKDLYSTEESEFMWNLAFALVSKDRVIAQMVFCRVRSFVTFHNIFMASGYELGTDTLWNGLTREDDTEEE